MVSLRELAALNVGIVSLTKALDLATATDIVTAGGLPAEAIGGAAALAERLWAVFVGQDATLVEVNPMIMTNDSQIMALDGKVTLDDNAAFRHNVDQFADPVGAEPDGQRRPKRGGA